MPTPGDSAKTEMMPSGSGSEKDASAARNNFALEANALRSLQSMTPIARPGEPENTDGALVQGLKSARYMAIQAPISGVSQIIDKVAHTNLEQSTKFFDAPAPAAFGTAEWHAQQIGGAAGMLVPFTALALTTRGALGKMGMTARAGLVAEGGMALKSARIAAIAEQGLNGFVYDFALRPSDSNSQNFWMDRTKHGIAGAATFSTLTASSIGLKQMIGVAPGATGIMNVLKRDVATGIASGVPAGLVNSNTSSLLETGKLAGLRANAEGIYTMSMVGGVLSAAHLMPGKQLTAAERVARGETAPSGAARLEANLARKAGETEVVTGTKGGSPLLDMTGLARGRELRGFASDKATEAAEGSGTPKALEKITLGDSEVLIESGKNYGDGSYKVKLAEDWGVNPAGTTIKFFPEASFPGGFKSDVGPIMAAAKHPDGTVLYTRTNGDSVYYFPEARESAFEVGDAVEAQKVEVLTNDTQRWHTTDNRLVEYHPDKAMPSNTTIGPIKRVDMTPWMSRFTTPEGNVYELVRDGQNMKLTAKENGEVTAESNINSFVEVFPKELNITRHGPVKERTTFADGTNLLLADGNTAFKYPEPLPYGDGRNVIDGIRQPNGWVRFFLDDGTIVDDRTGVETKGENDWVVMESRKDQSQIFEFAKGEKSEHRTDGSIKEVYPEGHQTSLGTVKEVLRTPEKYSYVLEDGTTIVLPLRGGPILRLNTNGGKSVINETRVTEVFGTKKQGEFGLLESLEVSNNGEIVQHLADHPEISSVTTLGAQRFRFTGFAQHKNGLYRMLLPNNRLDPTVLPEDGVQTALQTGTSPYHKKVHESR